MTLTLRLPHALQRTLAAGAERAGLPLGEYALRLLATRVPVPRTGAELVQQWESDGVIGARADAPHPEAHARALRDAAERRR